MSASSMRTSCRLPSAWPALCLWLCTTGTVWAECRPVAAAIATIRVDNDPFAWSNVGVPVDVVVTNDGDTECIVAAWLETADGRPTATVPLVDGVAMALSETGSPTRDETLPVSSLRIGAGVRGTMHLEMRSLTNGMAPAGEHAADAWLGLRIGEGSVDAARIPLRIVMRTAARAEATVSGSDAAGAPGIATVDFGALVEGDVRHLIVRVRANTESRLTIASQNSGRLMSTVAGTPGGLPEDGIPYEIRIAGDAVEPSRPYQRVVPMPASPSGTMLPLDLRIGPTGSHPAGRYADVLTIEASPL